MPDRVDEARERPAGPERREPTWFERWVLPYAREPVLWPVLVAILGHVVLLFALGILDVVRGTGFGAAALSLALTAALVGSEVRVARRPGPLTLSIVITWVFGVALAVFSLRTGFL